MATTAPPHALDPRLDTAADLIAEGSTDRAAALLDTINSELSLDGPPDHFNTAIFVKALVLKAGHRPPSINLYLRDLDLSQISLFNVLARHLPIVSLTGRIASDLLAGHLAARDEVTLLDVGIGTAQQEVTLLQTLADRDQLPRRLHVVGIEPSRSSLNEAETALRRAAGDVGVDLTFTGVHGLAEKMGDGDWLDLPVRRGDLLINAAFAAHHIQSQGDGPAAARDEVFARLAALNPTAVVLVEPNSDHLEPDWRRRFAHAAWHYGTLLRLIDAVGASRPDTLAMKMFFAREVDDVIANAEDTRAERHEPTSRWIARLQGAGLHPIQDLPALPALDDNPLVSAVSGTGHQTVGFGEDALVSVLAAGPTGRLADTGWTAPPADARAASGAIMVGGSANAALRVSDVMDPQVPTIAAHATRKHAADLLQQTQASDLAVVDEEGRFVGVLSEGDLLRSILPGDGAWTDSMVHAFELLSIQGRATASEAIDDLVIDEPITLSPDDDLLRASSLLLLHQIRRLPVVDDAGLLVGSVSRAALVDVLYEP